MDLSQLDNYHGTSFPSETSQFGLYRATISSTQIEMKAEDIV